jgi:hypothetical protein
MQLSSGYEILVDCFGRPWQFYKELESRDDLQLLKKEVNKYFLEIGQEVIGLADTACGGSSPHNQLVVNYLLLRACDIAQYGEKVANLTFPQPTIRCVTPDRVADSINGMVRILQNLTKQEEEEEKKNRLAEHDKRVIGPSLYERFGSNGNIPTPDNLGPLVLSYNQIEDLKAACLKELRQGGWNPQPTLDVIGDFVEFCDLLMQPENHINRPSMQYVKKQVNTRTFRDMEDEAAQELSRLPIRTAYVKVNRVKNGEHEILIRKIKTLPLTQPRLEGGELAERRNFIEDNMIDLIYVKPRKQIEKEIRERQEKWRSQAPDSPRRIPPTEEPPPTSYT